MISMKILFLLLFIKCTFIFAQLGEGKSMFPDLQSEINKKFPIENLADENGKKFTPDYLKGKITLLNFWFTTCEPCLEELPFMNKLQSELGTEINFVAVTFNSKDKVQDFLRHHAFNFTHITDMPKEMQVLSRRYPMTFIIDKNGNTISIISKIDEHRYDDIVKILRKKVGED